MNNKARRASLKFTAAMRTKKECETQTTGYDKNRPALHW